MLPTLEQLKSISKAAKATPTIASNMQSIIAGLETYGEKAGLDLPHRLAKYLGQLSHESGAFKYDKEIWGNTPAQQRYDTRTDLGNTKAKDGDGKRYMGRTGTQLTGKANYTSFRDWVRKNVDPKAPDFVKYPDKVNTDPWEGLVPIWFWTVGNSTGKSLNTYADENNDEMITRRINGGLNGYADRLDYTARASLVLAGYGPEDVLTFQKKVFTDSKEWDGLVGPKTRSKLHEVLARMAAPEIVADPDINVKKAPVTEVKEVAVAPKGVTNAGSDAGIVVGGTVLTAAAPKVAEQLLPTFGGLSQTVQLALIVVGVILLGWFLLRRLDLARRATAIINTVAARNENGLPH